MVIGLINQSQHFGFMTCLGGVVHLQLGDDILPVAVYGVLAYVQPVGNHLAGLAVLSEDETHQ